MYSSVDLAYLCHWEDQGMLPLWVHTSPEVEAAELKVLAAVISGTFSPKHGAG